MSWKDLFEHVTGEIKPFEESVEMNKAQSFVTIPYGRLRDENGVEELVGKFLGNYTLEEDPYAGYIFYSELDVESAKEACRKIYQAGNWKRVQRNHSSYEEEPFAIFVAAGPGEEPVWGIDSATRKERNGYYD